jgi:long-chain acyl-CoA synthetase
LRSGDLGKFDGDGFLYVTGRLSDLINFGGYKIDPIEVEQWLCSFPEIADAGVTAVESTITAEDVEVVAMIVVKNGFTLDDVSLFQRTRAGLDLFKVPRRWIKVGAIPRSATGKILRTELRQVAISNMRNDL